MLDPPAVLCPHTHTPLIGASLLASELMSSDSCGDGLTGLGHRLDYTMKGATGTGDGSDRPQKECSGSAFSRVVLCLCKYMC